MPTDTEPSENANPDDPLTIEPAADGDPVDRDQLPPLIIGEPFAYSGVNGQNNPQLLPQDDAVGVPGCNASILCGCGQPFLVDLLTDKPASICPHCSAAYTHVLVVAGLDDARVWGETNIEVLRANGMIEPDDDDDDLGDDDDAHESDGDDFDQRVALASGNTEPIQPSALVDANGKPIHS